MEKEPPEGRIDPKGASGLEDCNGLGMGADRGLELGLVSRGSKGRNEFLGSNNHRMRVDPRLVGVGSRQVGSGTESINVAP